MAAKEPGEGMERALVAKRVASVLACFGMWFHIVASLLLLALIIESAMSGKHVPNKVIIYWVCFTLVTVTWVILYRRVIHR